MSGVDKADPAPTRAKIQPFAMPRSFVGIQRETNWFEAGYMTASPAPNKNRAVRKSHRAPVILDGTEAVRPVKIPHQTTPAARTRRGPNLSTSLPPGV